VTAPRRRRELPDPYDPAHDGWWQAHDRLEVIASDAASIAAAARAARAAFCAGGSPHLDVLAQRLNHWRWDRRSLDVVADHVAASRHAAPGSQAAS
jgi:hypothetical protein